MGNARACARAYIALGAFLLFHLLYAQRACSYRCSTGARQRHFSRDRIAGAAIHLAHYRPLGAGTTALKHLSAHRILRYRSCCATKLPLDHPAHARSCTQRRELATGISLPASAFL